MKKLFINMINIQPGVTIGIVLLLVCRKFLKKNYTSKLNYMLWLVVALRLCLPFDITLPQSAPQVNIPVQDYYITQNRQTDKNNFTHIEFIPRQEYELLQQQPPVNINKGENVIVKSPPPVFSMTDIAVNLWIAVAAILVVTSYAPYFVLKSKLLSTAVYSKELKNYLDFVKSKLGIKQNVKICRCDYNGSPMLMGIVKPVIILPKTDYDEQHLAMIISHELTHLKRFDVSYKFLLHTLKCLYWFNPFIWLMEKYAVEDIELSCDEDITKNRNKDFKMRYAGAILKVASGNETRPVLSTAFSTEANAIKERFSNIFFGKIKKNGKSLLAGFMVVIIIATTVVGCGSENKIIEPENDNIKTISYFSDGLVDDTLYQIKTTYVEAAGASYGNIIVTDIKTQTSRYLCDVEGCNHINPGCTSYINIYNYASVNKLDEETLLLLCAMGNEDGLTNTLYTMNTDGTNKQVLSSMISDEAFFDVGVNIVKINDNLYFPVVNGEYEPCIMKINYKTKEKEIIPFFEHNIITADENNLYGFINTTVNSSDILYTISGYNINDGTSTELYSISKHHTENLMHTVANEKIYFSFTKDNHINILCYDPVTKTETKILDNHLIDRCTNAFMQNVFSNYIIFEAVMDDGYNKTMYCDISTGTVRELIIDQNKVGTFSLPEREYGDYFVMRYDGDDIEFEDDGLKPKPSHILCLIPQEDYLNGNIILTPFRFGQH